MVSPERKRQAVLHVQCELEVGEPGLHHDPPAAGHATLPRAQAGQRCGAGDGAAAPLGGAPARGLPQGDGAAAPSRHGDQRQACAAALAAGRAQGTASAAPAATARKQRQRHAAQASDAGQ